MKDKTIYDYMNIFKVVQGGYYHALDIAIQRYKGCFEIYKDAKTEEGKQHAWDIAVRIAEVTNPPIIIKYEN